MKLKFSKMHGLGNDFVVIDRISRDFEIKPERIRALGDRYTGIGFDQLLLVEAPRRPDADFFFHIYNTDGSEAEQCGNGARAFARFVIDQGLTVKRRLLLETVNGLIQVTLQDNGQVEVDMGEPVIEAACETLQLGDRDVEFSAISMGNPHAVVAVNDVAKAPVSELGAELSTHARFANGVNVGFAHYVDRSFVRLRVHERGVGETLACGSGACAAVVAGVTRGVLGERAKVALPGGKLRIAWNGPGDTVKMTGPATEVFRGEFTL